MGGFEPKAKPWNVDPIPDGFEFQLLPEDWDHFEILMQNAIHRTPCLETAEVKLLLNGPESFTLDGNFILGEAPELAGFFVCAGFNSAGHRQCGRCGQADRRVGRQRRSTDRPVGRRHPPLRAVPRESPPSRRPYRRVARPPLRDALAARGTRDGAPAAAVAAVRPACGEGRRVRLEDELGARELFPPGRRRAPPPTFGTPGWLPHVLDEQRACREDVVVFDQTSFGKFVLKGRDALDGARSGCARTNIDVPVGRMVYTAMLNARGGFETDLTIIRVAPTEFFIITGSAQTTRDVGVDRARNRCGRARGAGRRDERRIRSSR